MYPTWGVCLCMLCPSVLQLLTQVLSDHSSHISDRSKKHHAWVVAPYHVSIRQRISTGCIGLTSFIAVPLVQLYPLYCKLRVVWLMGVLLHPSCQLRSNIPRQWVASHEEVPAVCPVSRSTRVRIWDSVDHIALDRRHAAQQSCIW